MFHSRLTRYALAVMTMALVSVPAQAHRAWIKPSETVLSGEQNTVTVDAAVSNTLFLPEHVALNPNGIKVTAPNGESVALENIGQGQYRTTFDVPLNVQGTYRIATASAGLRAFWQDEEGDRHMWPSRRGPGEGETFANSVPKNAKDLRVTYGSRRVETFVTLGELSESTLAPSGQGLELLPKTHPNDLFASETAQFIFLIDGQPAEGVEIEVVRGYMRYRNDPETITLTTDQNGQFSVTWPHAGMYFIEASYRDDQAKAPATVRQGSYSAVLEVLPL